MYIPVVVYMSMHMHKFMNVLLSQSFYVPCIMFLLYSNFSLRFNKWCSATSLVKLNLTNHFLKTMGRVIICIQ